MHISGCGDQTLPQWVCRPGYGYHTRSLHVAAAGAGAGTGTGTVRAAPKSDYTNSLSIHPEAQPGAEVGSGTVHHRIPAYQKDEHLDPEAVVQKTWSLVGCWSVLVH